MKDSVKKVVKIFEMTNQPRNESSKDSHKINKKNISIRDEIHSIVDFIDLVT